MKKTAKPEPQKPQTQEPGRVLARTLAESLSEVQGGIIHTFTRGYEPDTYDLD